MPTLHVRNVPDRTYERLRKLAESNRHTLSAEVLSLIERAVEAQPKRIDSKKLMARIRRMSIKLPPDAPTPEEILRADRDR